MTKQELKTRLQQALDAVDKLNDDGYSIRYLTIDEEDLDPSSDVNYDPKGGPRILFDYGLDLATRPKDDASADESLPVTQIWRSKWGRELRVETNGCHLYQYDIVEEPKKCPHIDPEETDKPE